MGDLTFGMLTLTTEALSHRDHHRCLSTRHILFFQNNPANKPSRRIPPGPTQRPRTEPNVALMLPVLTLTLANGLTVPPSQWRSAQTVIDSSAVYLPGGLCKTLNTMLSTKRKLTRSQNRWYRRRSPLSC